MECLFWKCLFDNRAFYWDRAIFAIDGLITILPFSWGPFIVVRLYLVLKPMHVMESSGSVPISALDFVWIR